MGKKLIDIKEIKDIMSYMGCSLNEALYYAKRFKGLSPSDAYKYGWFDGMYAGKQGLIEIYNDALNAAKQHEKSSNSDETNQ